MLISLLVMSVEWYQVFVSNTTGKYKIFRISIRRCVTVTTVNFSQFPQCREAPQYSRSQEIEIYIIHQPENFNLPVRSDITEFVFPASICVQARVEAIKFGRRKRFLVLRLFVFYSFLISDCFSLISRIISSPVTGFVKSASAERATCNQSR